MSDDVKWIRESLRAQLELLALPGDAALARLPDGCVKADELALDFDNFYSAYIANCRDEITPRLTDVLQAIDGDFSAMSRSGSRDLWTEEAVRTHPAGARSDHLPQKPWACLTK